MPDSQDPRTPSSPEPLRRSPPAPLTPGQWEHFSDMAAIACDWAFIVWAKGDLVRFCTVDEETWYCLTRNYVDSVIAHLMCAQPEGLPLDAWRALTADLYLGTLGPTTADYLAQFSIFSDLPYPLSFV